MPDLWSLRVLLEVGRRGSFSAAAEALSMTQPAVSRQIATLERRTGVRLFHRRPRGVQPTEAGLAAIEQAAAVVDGMSLFETRLRAFATAESGSVRVTAFPSAATRFVPESFRRFTATHPDVELSLTVGEHGGSGVLAGAADVALVTSWDAAPDPGLDLLFLFDDEPMVALPAGHPLAAQEQVRLADLSGEPWIDGTHPDCLGPISELSAAMGGAPRITHLCDDWNGRQGLVAAGVGVMLYPSIAGRSVRSDIRLVHPSPSLPARRISVAVLPAHGRPPAVSAYLDVLREMSAAYGRTAPTSRLP
ncbi:LysR family transcriptional regulator [Nonomuraea africana]|uniref:DNA-binding transcriptional LysR family regulator n=1 Tax=Nonomuraea africana TaxID=46171 RepID=A0ABR9KIH0_9ACTN|nr:LysR family transcriptional regulator [Nonomuraea africana]MBE1561600.1 DNA-binding transcriptional LysR family regulator [Nonomuraea africana]